MARLPARYVITANSLVLLVLAVIFCTSACRSFPECRKDKHCVRYIEQGRSDGRSWPHCVDSQCSECLEDSECGPGEECRNNACAPEHCGCDEEIGCPGPQVCRDCRCGPQCLSDSYCAALGPWAYCQGGACMQGECGVDSDCGEGGRCERHHCVERSTSDEACGEDQFRTIYFDFDEFAIPASERANLSWNQACFDR